MKTSHTLYNPDTIKHKKSSDINLISLFSWISVVVVVMIFWAGVAVVYNRDYVPDTVAKIEQKEKKFLTTHKALQKKLSVIRSLV